MNKPMAGGTLLERVLKKKETSFINVESAMLCRAQSSGTLWLPSPTPIFHYRSDLLQGFYLWMLFNATISFPRRIPTVGGEQVGERCRHI